MIPRFCRRRGGLASPFVTDLDMDASSAEAIGASRALEAWAGRRIGPWRPGRARRRPGPATVRAHRRRGRAHSDPTDLAPLADHHTPMMLHQIGPTTSQMAMCTIPSTSPVRHHVPSSTYPDPKYSGAGPLP